MNTFTATIGLENDCFQPNPCPEIQRTITDGVTRLDEVTRRHSRESNIDEVVVALMDANGNTVGEAGLYKAPHTGDSVGDALLKICKEIAGSGCDLGDSERRIRLYAAISKADPGWL